MKVKRSLKFKRSLKSKRFREKRRIFKLKRRIKVKPKVNVRRPNPFLYFLAYTLIYPALKICFKVKVDRSSLEMPKGAYIVLANHITMLDFLLAMLPLYPRRLNAVTAHKWFLSKPLNTMLPKVGCIPKNMFDPDVRSIISMKTVLNRGDSILLFPEGRCSSSQVYTGMHKSTGKLIKKFNVPVISCYLEGAEVCVPHWRKGFRFGRIRVTYKNLFSADDTQAFSIDDINTAIDARLSGTEGASPVIKPFQTAFSRRLAEGLHQILFYCPKCKMEFTMTSFSNTIRCTACGNEATINRDSSLTPSPGSIAEKEISLWYKEQVKQIMSTLTDDMEPITENVKVRMPSSVQGGGMVDSGFGVIRLEPKGWYYDGELSGEKVNLFFPVETIPAISYDHYDNFQIYYAGDFYMFIPENLQNCIKYVILAECLHKKFSPRALMTQGNNSGFIS